MRAVSGSQVRPTGATTQKDWQLGKGKIGPHDEGSNWPKGQITYRDPPVPTVTGFTRVFIE